MTVSLNASASSLQVDEILFQSAIHPAQRCNTLSTSQLLTLHAQIQTVINTAVAVNADHKLFPKNWLFKYRWGKGRVSEPKTFTLPDGSTAVVTHMTVGGRTSAIVESVQKLLGDDQAAEGSEEEVDGKREVDLEEDENIEESTVIKPKRKTRARKNIKTDNDEAKTSLMSSSSAKTRGRKRKKHESQTPSPATTSDAESDLTALQRLDDEQGLQSGPKTNIVQISAPSKSRKAGRSKRATETETVVGIDKVEVTRPAASTTRRTTRGRKAVKAEVSES